MDKRKINIEELYQKRFQSFEMEQSADISLRMQKKMRFAKSIQLLKWISIAVLATATAVTITLLSLSNDPISYEETPTNSISEPQNIQNKSNTHQTEEASLLLNTQNTKTTPIKQSHPNEEFISKDETLNNFSEPPLKEQAHSAKLKKPMLEEPVENSNPDETKQNPSQKTTNSVNSEMNEFKETQRIEPSNNFESEHLDFLDSKSIYLKNPTPHLPLKKTNLNLQASNFDQNATKPKQKKNGFADGFNTLEQKPSRFTGYFDLHYSPLFWQNNSAINPPSLDSSWTQSISQQAQLSTEWGFAFQLHHQNFPLFLQLGLDYQIMKEKVDFLFSHTFEDLNQSYWTNDSLWNIVDVLDTVFIYMDDNHFVIDSIFRQDTLLSGIDSSYFAVYKTDETKHSGINTYRYLNIPLLIGYGFQSKNQHWSFQILSGAAIAINLKNEGFYYSNDAQINSYSGKVNPSLVWHFYAAANLNYQWKKWQFFLQPEYQLQLNESELSAEMIKRKHQFYKVKLGIRMRIF